MTNEQIAQSELGMIASYVDEFAEKGKILPREN